MKKRKPYLIIKEQPELKIVVPAKIVEQKAEQNRIESLWQFLLPPF